MERQGGNKHIVSLPQKNKKFFLYLCSYILTQDYTTMTEDQNLASLFENLNQISRAAITQSREGGSTGGGGMDLSGNMDANRLIGMNPYMGQNVTSFNMGGTFDGLSPQEYLYNTTGLDLTGSFRAQAIRDRQEAANQAFYQNIQDTGRMRFSNQPTSAELVADKQAKDDAFVEQIKSGQGLAAEGMKFMQNPYVDKKMTKESPRYDKGGQLTPAEYKKVSKLGRSGDTQLAHINSKEADMLRAMGGAGTINPYTGLPEYRFRFRNPFRKLRDIVDTVVGGATDILDPVIDTATDVLEPVFDTAGNVVESTIAPAADIVGEGAQVGLDLLDKGVKGATKGIKSLGFDFVLPLAETVGTPILEGMHYLSDLLSGGDVTMPKLEAGPDPKIRREEGKRVDMADASPAQLKMREKLSGLKKDTADTLTQGDFVGDKPNPFVTENVEEELDYAAEGMKYKYDDGGKEGLRNVLDSVRNEMATNPANMMNIINQVTAMKQAGDFMIGQANRANMNMNMKMAKGGAFKPHMMYDPKTGKGYKANKLQDHLDMKEKGYDHRKRNPKNYTNGGRF